MTLSDSISAFGKLSAKKRDFLKSNPLGFFVSAMMAGAYVGIGILLIFTVGQTAAPEIRNLIMGVSFGIALTLVIFAGSELFTGYTMYMSIGRLTAKVNSFDALATCASAWGGNLIGSAFLASIFVVGGGGVILYNDANSLLHLVAAKKMSSTAIELFARAILCNWLVCLAIWCSYRTQSDSAKCIIIFWCLFAFVACGFEHSVANMTVFSVALLSEHPATISLAGAAHNLLWVTLGNAFSGAIFMGYGYWLAARTPKNVES